MQECKNCASENMWAGQAFTPYVCGDCGIEKMHHNTGTPVRCEVCSMAKGMCQRCDNPLPAAHGSEETRTGDNGAQI